MQLYINTLQENYTLKEKLQEVELLLSQNKVELERLRQVGGGEGLEAGICLSQL